MHTHQSLNRVQPHGGWAGRSSEFISIQSLAAKGEEEAGMMQGTADVPHPIAAAHLP